MKKIIFVFLSVILGILLSFVVHAVIEILYLNWAIRINATIEWTRVFGDKSCALPLWLIYLLPVLGIVFGFWLGLYLRKKQKKLIV